METTRDTLKTIALILLFNLAIAISLLAQPPQAISYQAIARNNAGNPLTNQLISLRFSIRETSALGIISYRETHSLTTSSLGSFSVNIGQGTVVLGTFAGVIWGVNNKFLQVEMDPAGGAAFVDLGTQQMLSVPYALYAGSTTGGWTTTGNSGTSDATNFIGTIDNIPLNFRVGNQKSGRIDRTQFNTFLGGLSGSAITSGTNNTAVGAFSLTSTTTGAANVGVGYNTLQTAVASQYATAVGYLSQQYAYNVGPFNSWNTSIGAFALQGSVTPALNTGLFNTAVGASSMSNNSSGAYNTAVGMSSLVLNTSGNFNTAVGKGSMSANTSGQNNAAFGYETLIANIDGIRNTAIGNIALYDCTSCTDNTAIGSSALSNLTVTDYNTALGSFAGASQDHGNLNTFLGRSANASGAGFINSTAVGGNSTVSASNQVRVGSSTVTSIGGQVSWTTISDSRFKQNVKSDVHGLDFVLQLNPVTYTLDVNTINQFLGVEAREKELGINYSDEENAQAKKLIEEKEKIIFSGFLAQDVEAIAKSVGYDFSGIDAPKNENDFYGLRYADFVVPLVKAVQEQQEIIENQKQQILQMQQVNAKLLQETSAMKSDIEMIKAELGHKVLSTKY